MLSQLAQLIWALLSLDSFRKNNLSASWKVIGVEMTSVENNANSEPKQTAKVFKQEAATGKDDLSDDHTQSIDTPAQLA
uniref:Polygalacturonate 4-alpha-galacturonosyltransferase-like isoform X2 n=1 Tax=Rhizophora mucronata TaxID=61149 RepID=A0A2P2P073_RHIMU